MQSSHSTSLLLTGRAASLDREEIALFENLNLSLDFLLLFLLILILVGIISGLILG